MATRTILAGALLLALQRFVRLAEAQAYNAVDANGTNYIKTVFNAAWWDNRRESNLIWSGDPTFVTSTLSPTYDAAGSFARLKALDRAAAAIIIDSSSFPVRLVHARESGNC